MNAMSLEDILLLQQAELEQLAAVEQIEAAQAAELEQMDDATYEALATQEAAAAGMDLSTYIGAIQSEVAQAQEAELIALEELAYYEGVAQYEAELSAQALAIGVSPAELAYAQELEFAQAQELEMAQLAELEALGLIQ